MKLLKLYAKHYRSLRDVSLEFSDLNLFIGANASGKSTVLDALRLLHEGVQTRDFRTPVFSRGGIIHLAWKGKEAERIDVSVKLADADKTWEWSVCLIRAGYEFHVEEQLEELLPGSPPVPILHANKGDGWWWSGTEKRKITLKQAPTACALTAAAADASFPAREVAEFVRRWGFFDPNPFLLRHDWTGLDSGSFDPYGRNLAETLHALQNSSPEVCRTNLFSDSVHRWPPIRNRNSGDRRPIPLCPNRAGTPVLRAPNGSIQRHLAHAGAHDRATRTTRSDADRNRGTGELRSPNCPVFLRRASSEYTRSRPVPGNDPLSSAPRLPERSSSRSCCATQRTRRHNGRAGERPGGGTKCPGCVRIRPRAILRDKGLWSRLRWVDT